jgi:putative glutamine amidotransferase
MLSRIRPCQALPLILAGLMLNCHPAYRADGPAPARILLINPSQRDLEDMVSLVKTGIIRLEHPELIAVYGAMVERPWALIKSHMEKQDLAFVRFEIVPGELLPATLYQTNGCSESFRRLFRHSEAALFFGGADLPPETYGQKTSLLTVISSPQRHYFELSFLFHLLGGDQDRDFEPLLNEKPDYVIRGFCLGMQSMNVATGGTMIQDIPSEIYQLGFVEDYLHLADSLRHDNYWPMLMPQENIFSYHFQPIRFSAGGFFITELEQRPQDRPFVCSSHHQAVDRLGKGLQVAATSLDGRVVEALTHRRFANVLGVQFHPEPFAIYQNTGRGSKITPQDTSTTTLHDYLAAKGSLEFHYAFWSCFSRLLSGTAEEKHQGLQKNVR